MSANNTSLPSDKEQAAAGDEKSPAENFSVIESKNTDSDEHSGSVWSHLLFGLGTLALIAPLFIPGIPMRTLVVIYVVLMSVVMVACIIWNILKSRPPRR